MKKGLVFCFALAFVMVSTAAYANRENTGCGFGTMVLNENNDSLASQALAVGLNALLSNQPLAISSGTSNCEKPDSLVMNTKVNTFVADNMDHIASDIARGHGEYLDTLAVLMEVSPEKRPAMYGVLQDNFDAIYPTEKVTHIEVLQNIETIL